MGTIKDGRYEVEIKTKRIYDFNILNNIIAKLEKQLEGVKTKIDSLKSIKTEMKNAGLVE